MPDDLGRRHNKGMSQHDFTVYEQAARSRFLEGDLESSFGYVEF